MNSKQEISRAQIIKIHIAKKELRISDLNHKEALSGFINSKGEPCSSSKELNFEQAEILLNAYKKLGWVEKRKVKRLKYEEYNNRSGKFASPKQMRMIEAMWMQHSREKTEASMNRFIKRITGVDHISFLLRADVSKTIKAIESLNSITQQGSQSEV
jgi:hypothetical protein